MKVQIALVGGQTMPVYLGINEFDPDVIVLIHSEGTRVLTERIAAEYQGKTRMLCIDPVDMPQIQTKVDKLLDEFKDDEVSVNLTGGTKPWAIAFALHAQGRQNVNLIYVDQNCTFYDYTKGAKWQSSNVLSLQQLMRINGQIAKSHNSLSSYDDDDLDTLATVKSLRKKAPADFNALTIPDKSWRRTLEGGNEGFHDLKDGSYIEWKKTEDYVHIVMHAKWVWIDKELESPNVMHIVFNSGWFEYEVAEMLSHWSHAKEVWLNVVYPYREGQAKNEIDIVINTGVKLLMVECKTQIFDNTDIDKFHTAVKNYGGMGCKSLFITESHMKDAAKEKCADSQVMAFCLNDYSSQAEAQKKLFAMLDKELFNINAK